MNREEQNVKWRVDIIKLNTYCLYKKKKKIKKEDKTTITTTTKCNVQIKF